MNSQNLLCSHHPLYTTPGESTRAWLSLCLPWPHPQPNLQLHELMQQEFIYKLIIPVNHVQLELGLNKELRSGPSSSYARRLGKGMGLTAPRAKRADGSSGWEVALASPAVCSGFSNSRAFPNSGIIPTQRPQMEDLAGNHFLFLSPKMHHLTG